MRLLGQFLIIALSCFSETVNAQRIVAGIVLDNLTQMPLPYVNIGIKEKEVGTCSALDGSFTLSIPSINEEDTLTFSVPGYDAVTRPIRRLSANSREKIELTKLLTDEPGRSQREKISSAKINPNDTSALPLNTNTPTHPDDIFEVAQVISFTNHSNLITSVSLYFYMMRTKIDSGIFRLNFYGFDGKQPTHRQVERNIVEAQKGLDDYLTFDLSENPIWLAPPFVVGIEFLPFEDRQEPSSLELQTRSNGKCFLRKSSQGVWHQIAKKYLIIVNVRDYRHPSKVEQKRLAALQPKLVTKLFSNHINDSFNIFVKLPKGYQPGGKIRYPVVYLLDANAYMQEVADSMIVKNTKAILVGVGYNNMEAMDSLRERDYTFPKALASDSFAVSGGAPKFLSFLQKELQPYIHQNYSVDTTNETLMGHSLGGYFTLYALTQALLQKQGSFQHFVAASPSLGYSHQYIIKQFRKILQDHSASPKTLRITLGGQEDVEDDSGTESSDQFNKLVQILKRPAFKNLNLSAEIYPNLGHMETVVPTFTAAINAIRPTQILK